MSQYVADTGTANLRWKDLYKIGGTTAVALAIMVVMAVIAFFIWPYAPGNMSTENIFALIQTNKLGGLMALDFFLLVATLCSIPVVLTMYVSLKQVNESYALIALVLGLVSIVSIIPARPISGLFHLSDQYAAATTDAARNQYLAAGEALLAVFDGSAWLAYVLLMSASYLTSSFLMLQSNAFTKTTAYLGIAINAAAGMGPFLSGIGLVLLFLSTLGSVIWCIRLGREFLRLGQQAVSNRQQKGAST
ncbi:MAG: DUF4386 family protein [Chloroflexi bacterium]|nr:DUF4386 family protein [Chloroflexota bacterium]